MVHKESETQLNHGSKSIRDVIWKCEQLWAGKLYSRTTFDTLKEAKEFVSMIWEREPDHTFLIEAVEAGQTWN
jgi:hypothetical protein